MRIGANYLGNRRCEFVVWGPFLKDVMVKIISPKEQTIRMEKDGTGYRKVVTDDVSPGALYFYKLDGLLERPDPASNFQPRGVHGPSQVMGHGAFKWTDENWPGVPLEEMVIYELHVGTFTRNGTFKAIIQRLDDLCDLGVNAVELMPITQFPGERNWGYDGAYPFAVQNSYGGPKEMKRFVNDCHRRGMAVILDVVYNHLGPEGNYLGDFGPYFSEKYKTSWGYALNFDGAYSDDVRNFFIENALYWLREYHADALRLDAIHAIYDMSAKPFLQELAEKVEEFSSQKGRKFYLIAENDLNDVKVVRSRKSGGYGIDAAWCDDFHHSIHTLLTGETAGYYADFGKVEHLVKALREGFVYSWQYSPYRKRRQGSSSKGIPGRQFVVYSQNHDQVGNRMLGERLSKLVSFEALKLAAGVTLLSPYIPLLFMGEEYDEESPFLYFTSHSNRDLINAVKEGRKADFQAFRWEGEPPDPQSQRTFLRSKLKWEMRKEGKHKTLLKFYRRLIQLRREIPAVSNLDKTSLEVSGTERERLILLRRWRDRNQVLCVMNFNKVGTTFRASPPKGSWEKIIDSSERVWGGRGPSMPEEIMKKQDLIMMPLSFVLYKKKEAST
jgi:maltooligosyltrehalose trehalohydrolase